MFDPLPGHPSQATWPYCVKQTPDLMVELCQIVTTKSSTGWATNHLLRLFEVGAEGLNLQVYLSYLSLVLLPSTHFAGKRVVSWNGQPGNPTPAVGTPAIQICSNCIAVHCFCVCLFVFCTRLIVSNENFCDNHLQFNTNNYIKITGVLNKYERYH